MQLLLLFLWHLSISLAGGDQTSLHHPRSDDSALENGTYGSYPTQKFVSSGIVAPRTYFLSRSQECDDTQMYYFITPKGWKVSKPGPMILDWDGSMVWFEHFSNEWGGQAYDLRVQRYHGEDYLTFWLGDDTVRGHGAGHYYMLNSAYEVVNKVGAAGSMYADLHDFVITEEGSALMIAFDVVPGDTRPAGRKFNDVWNQAIWDNVFQEVYLENSELRFEWRASEHINITDSYHTLEPGDGGTHQNPHDFFHMNSVDKDELGNYLISARNTHAVYYIDGRTGDLLWTLGGKKNQFMDLSGGRALNFAWQHDARFVALNAFPETYNPPGEKYGVTTRLLTLFDNAALDWDYSFGMPYTRGLLLEITYPTPHQPDSQAAELSKHVTPRSPAGIFKRLPPALSAKDEDKFSAIDGTDSAYTVRVIRKYVHPKRFQSSTQGSLQLLFPTEGDKKEQKKKDPKVILGYGLNAVVTEYNSSGTPLCDLHFGAETSWEKGDVQSYRAYKFKWTGRPKQPPAGKIIGTSGYVSWNGATEVCAWELQGSTSATAEDWTVVTRVEKEGFETVLLLRAMMERIADKRYLRFVALDCDGNVCENGVGLPIDRRSLRAMLGQLSGTDISVSFSAILLVGSVVGLAVVYRLFRRYVLRRGGRGYYSPLVRRQD